MPPRVQEFSFHYPPVDRQLLQLGCYLTSIGELHYPPNVKYPVPGHPELYKIDWEKGRSSLTDFALVLITAGEGQFETNKIALTRINAGNFIFLVPGEWHRYRPNRATGWTEKWVCLNGHYLHQLRANGLLPARSTLLKLADAAALEPLLDALFIEVAHTPRQNRLGWSAQAMGILFKVIEGFERVRAPHAAHRPPATDALVDQALHFIRENCHRPINVKTVAENCGTVRRTLERRFAEHHERTVAHEIVHGRIERAEMLLADSNLPVKEIAFACGFGSAQRMIYLFHRHRKLTPGQARKLNA